MMNNGLFQSSVIPVLEQVASFAEARHGLLAGNVANLDTPGYRVRDLSVETFQERLREAIETRETARASGHDSPGLLAPGAVTDSHDEAMRRVKDSMTSILYHDDSNVGMEQQVLELSKNNFLHNLAVSVMSSQFRLLQSAIREQV